MPSYVFEDEETKPKQAFSYAFEDEVAPPEPERPVFEAPDPTGMLDYSGGVGPETETNVGAWLKAGGKGIAHALTSTAPAMVNASARQFVDRSQSLDKAGASSLIDSDQEVETPEYTRAFTKNLSDKLGVGVDVWNAVGRPLELPASATKGEQRAFGVGESLGLVGAVVPFGAVGGPVALGIGASGQKYDELIRSGVEPERAHKAALITGVAETVPELFSFRIGLSKKIPFLKKAIYGQVSELLGESTTSATQLGADIWAMNPGKSREEIAAQYASEIGDTLTETVIQTMIQAPIQSAGMHGISRLQSRSEQAARKKYGPGSAGGQPLDVTNEVRPNAQPEVVEGQGKPARRIEDIIKRAETFSKPGGELYQGMDEAGKEAAPFEEKPIPTDATPLPDKYQANAVKAGTLRDMVRDNNPDVPEHVKGGLEAGKMTPDEARQLLNDGQSLASRENRPYPSVIDETAKVIDEFEKQSPEVRKAATPSAASPQGQPEVTKPEVAPPLKEDLLKFMRYGTELGVPGERGPINAEHPDPDKRGKPEWYTNSMYPDWFEGESRIEVLHLIDKALSGKKLTDIQRAKLDHLSNLATPEYERYARTHREPVKAWDLEPGDKMTVGGEKFKVTERDESEFFPKVKVKNGLTYEIVGDEEIPIDPGSLVKNEQDISLTAPEVPKAKGKPKQEWFSFGQVKGEALKAPERENKPVSMDDLELGKATNAARDREKQGSLGVPFAPEKDFRREPDRVSTEEGITRRSDIAKFLQEKLDVPIRTGRFRNQALGIFKTKAEVIRTKHANDIEVIAHEIGHGLQKFLWPETIKKGSFTDSRFSPFKTELEPIATTPNAASSRSAEGFAEFVRLYVTNEAKARKVAPRFYDFFETTLSEQAPEARDILLEARKNYDRWMKQPSLARVLSTISTGEKVKRSTTFEDLYTMTIDEMHPLKKMVDEMSKGQQVPFEMDPYKKARLLPGMWGKADAWLDYKPFNFKTYEFEGKALKDILTPVKDRLDEFRAYIKSKRVLELEKRGIETGVLKKDAQEVVKKYWSTFESTAHDLYTYNRRLLTYLKDSGLISEESFNKMQEANKDYVPFYRVMDTEKKGSGTGKGIEAYQPTKRIKGSWRDTIDPLESIIKNTYLYVTLAEKNEVGKSLVRLAGSRDGLGKYVEKIPLSMQKTTVKAEELARLDPELGAMVADLGLSEESIAVFNPAAFQPKDNVISVWNKGKRELYQVHPDIARTFQALDREQSNLLIRLLSIPARWLRAGATLSPEFIARNPIRDQYSAFIFSKYGFTPGVDLVKGIFHAAKKDNLYWQWKISGGEHSMLVSLDREYLQKNLEKVMQSKAGALKDVIKNPIEALRIFSEFGEIGTRLGEFGKGIKKEGSTKEGLQRAAFASREVTLDFARQGAKTRAVNSLIAFWNAQVQGVDKMTRAFKDNPIRATAKAMAAITLPSVLLAISNEDDGRYEEIPQWQKDLFWIIPSGFVSKSRWAGMTPEEKAQFAKENRVWRIPKPFELGLLFGSVPERIIHWMKSKDSKSFDGMLWSLGRGVMPGVMPTIMIPHVENWANKSTFTGRPIVPKAKEGLLPAYQAAHYTSETAKAISKALSKIPGIGDEGTVSPAKAENLIRGWSGGLGMHILATTDKMLRASGIVPEKVKPGKVPSDMPFIKAFAVRYPASDAESIQRFYDNYERSERYKKTAKYLEKEGMDFQDFEDQVISLSQVKTALGNAWKEIDSVEKVPDLLPEEKRQLIDTIYFHMIDIAKEGNQSYADMLVEDVKTKN